jgi:hypothetical protein
MHVKRSEEMHGVLYNEKLAKNERKWVGLMVTIYEIISLISFLQLPIWKFESSSC